ncbi:MAG: type IV pilin N-terminal domain-containing protein [Thermoplasmata archaeon]|nr:type IV pilin N-terminal domain-containing protein [Thermoplasmata archaeon]
MKKIWALRKATEAVSPVIATILMVAITVVLAAVLYVMVLGFTPTTVNNIVISFSQGSTSTNYTLTVISIQGGTLQLSDCQALFKDANGDPGASGLLSTFDDTWKGNVKYNDVNDDGKVNAPDYIQLNKVAYAVGSSMVLSDVGGTTTFTQVTIS